MTKWPSPAYIDLIREAFIGSIRSALIVDDEYPSLDAALEERIDLSLENQVGERSSLPHEDRNEEWRMSIPKMRKVFMELRAMEKPCLIDVHNGELPDPKWAEKEAKRLQQTDLLVLDFELKQSTPNIGSKAIRIAREALLNAHFNLIIVHTQCELEEAFNSILLGLLPALSSDKRIQDQIYDIENGVGGEDRDNFNLNRYLDFRHKLLRGRNGDDLSADKKELNESALIFEASNNFEFATEDMQVKDWRELDESGPCWIRCAKGFIAFKKKDETPLLDALHDALVSWCPHQSRLILTKLRTAMNERGVEVQDDALGETTVGASWYHKLLSAGDFSGIDVETIARNHGEQLFDQLLPSVVDFARNLLMADSGDYNPIEVIKEAYNVDLSEEKEHLDSILRHNTFVGSKPVSGNHLDLGHILYIDGNYWLCLSPACDMVPGRYVLNFMENQLDFSKNLKRFAALRLYQECIDFNSTKPGQRDKIFGDAIKRGTVFANIYKECGSVTPTIFQISKESNSIPVWMTMYACNGGCFDEVKDHKIDYEIDVQFLNSSADGNGLDFQRSEAKVCGQLRSEYALNAQAKLVQSLSRIGLDYQPLKDERRISQKGKQH